MATTTVLYTLNLAGTLQAGAPKLSDDLKKLGNEAQAAKIKLDGTSAAAARQTGGFAAAAKAMNQNALISQLETVTSLFTQVGGSVSQASIIVTSAIRPVALLATVLGSAGVAALSLPLVFGAVGFGAKAMANSALDARDRLKALGIEVGGQNKTNLDSYAAAMRDLGIMIDRVKVSLGGGVAGELAVLARVVSSNIGPAMVNAGRASDALGTALNYVTLGAKPLAEVLGGILYDDLTKTARSATEAAGKMQDLTDAIKLASAEAAKLNNELAHQAQGMEREALEDLARGKAEALRLEQEGIRAIEERWGSAAKAAEGYAGVVSGLNVGAGSVDLGAPTTAIPMGQQTGPTAGLSGDSGIPDAVTESGDGVMDKIGGLQSSVMGGMGSMIGMITGIRDSIRGMLEFLKTFGDMSMDDAQLIIDTILGFSDQLGMIISEVPMKIIDAMPDMITAILAIIPQLILDLIASGPKILVSVIKAIIALPGTIAKAFGDMFAEFWADIKAAFEELASIFTGKEGKVLGTSFAGKANEGNRSVFGIHVEKFHSGGTVTRSGLAELQAGEVVSTPSQMRQRGGGSQRASVTINVNGAQDTERIVREIRAKLGSYGVGLTLEPYGGR